MSNGKRDFDIAELKSVLEDAYAIGEITGIESITCDEEELLSTTNALPTSSKSSSGEGFRNSFRVSAGGKNYFLKRVCGSIEESRLIGIEEFIGWAEKHNYMLSPALIVSNSGQTHIAVGENRFQLFDFLEQEKRQIWMRSQLSQEDCTLAGGLLARMHVASAEYLRENADEKDFSLNSSGLGGKFRSIYSTHQRRRHRLLPRLVDRCRKKRMTLEDDCLKP